MVQTTTVDNGCGAAFYALSPMQQGMLFHRVNGSEPGTDIEQVVGELRHAVSPPEFEQAWNLVFRRHDALRTAFLWAESQEPRQRVMPADEVSVAVRVLDFSGAGDVESVLEQYLAADRKAGFSSLTAPLFRVALFLADENRSWFVFTYHHLVLDARGMVPLFRQVLDLHDALVRGQAVELPPVRPYREYIQWLQTLDLRRAESFWREQLQGFGAPTALNLPAASDAVAGDVSAAELAMRFSPRETTQVREAARRHDVSVNNLLQGAWALVLSRYSGEDDVVFGAVRACRHVPVEGAAAMVGMLINTVPFRVRLAAAASVDHWLRGLKEQWVALRDYEHTPLMQVQRWAEIPGGRSLFDTLFNYQEPSWMATLAALGGPWTQRSFEIRSQPGYPLSLDLYGDEALLVRAFYDRRRFDGAAVARLLRHFRAAVLALSDARTDTLRDVTLLDEAERHQVLIEFNRTAADYPRETTVLAEFERHAAASPDRVAITDASGSLTYREVNERAERLAERLRDFGVTRDVPVAVCMKRSAEMIVAWLAAWKASGCYLPLDPEYPRERLAFQLQDSQAAVLVTTPACRAQLTDLAIPVVEVGGSELGRVVPAAPTSSPSAHDLAYLIYTSGSTGQPKGVQIEHRALMNLVSWHQRAYEITPDDRATHLASPAFDASVWEVWPYLASGASVHIPDEDTRLSVGKLWSWLAEQHITIAFMPTPLAEAALAEPGPERLALRALLTGGDQLKRPAPAGFPARLINHYGPTESTVVATAGTVSGREAGAPPIGRPIANTTAYVLDRELRPVPVGVPGELYLGGESLARGYHLRPDLNAEKFVPNPFAETRAVEAELSPFDLQPSPRAGVTPRLYRTGDLVRWRADGQLEFLGRIDHQVKIRGCRIELGEIEAALQKHPAVREAVVVARPDDRGQPQLVGYVVGGGAPATSEDELIDHLRTKLPAYMVPAAVLILASWPLTPNGKIDRRALPAPASKSTARTAEFVAPRNETEQAIATVFGEVLSRTLGVFDDFFELGGHSLLAAQAITRLNATLGASISVRMLFDHPTVAAFADALSRQGNSAPRPALRPKRRAARSEMELVQPS